MSDSACLRCGRDQYHARGLCRPCYSRDYYTGRITPRTEVDEAAVLRLMSGDTVWATAAERAEATRRLTERGLSAAQIAERLRRTPRTVARYRGRGRAA